MPRTGSGNFVPLSPQMPFTNGTLADGTAVTAVINDMCSGLTQSISADGQTPVTGNLNMGGHNITNAGAINTGTINNTGAIVSHGNISAPSQQIGALSVFNSGTACLVVETGIAINFPAIALDNHANAAGAIGMLIRNDRTDGYAILFQFGASTIVGSITQNGTTTSYNTSSDYRLKTTYGPADTGAIIDAVPVYDAAFTVRPQERRPMMLAHELAEVMPSAVIGDKDATYGDGSVLAQQVNYLALIPAMWGEIQALRRRVAALEAR